MPRSILVATAVLFLDELLFNLIVPLVPRYAERFDLATSEVGLLLAAYPLLMLLAGIPGGLLVARAGARPVLVGGALLLAMSAAAAGLADEIWQLWLARAALGLVSGVTLTAAVVTVVAATPSARRGRALATTFAVAGVGAILGPAVGGIVMPALGLAAGHLLVAAAALAVAVVGLAVSWPAGGRVAPGGQRRRAASARTTRGAARRRGHRGLRARGRRRADARAAAAGAGRPGRGRDRARLRRRHGGGRPRRTRRRDARGPPRRARC